MPPEDIAECVSVFDAAAAIESWELKLNYKPDHWGRLPIAIVPWQHTSTSLIPSGDGDTPVEAARPTRAQ